MMMVLGVIVTSLFIADATAQSGHALKINKVVVGPAGVSIDQRVTATITFESAGLAANIGKTVTITYNYPGGSYTDSAVISGNTVVLNGFQTSGIPATPYAVTYTIDAAGDDSKSGSFQVYGPAASFTFESGFRSSWETNARASLRRSWIAATFSWSALTRYTNQHTKREPANITIVSTGTLSLRPSRPWKGWMNSELLTIVPSALASKPDPNPRQDVSAAAIAVKSTSGGLAPKRGMAAQWTTVVMATTATTTPRSGTRSRVVMLARGRRRRTGSGYAGIGYSPEFARSPKRVWMSLIKIGDPAAGRKLDH
jgi:hypothetical protein